MSETVTAKRLREERERDRKKGEGCERSNIDEVVWFRTNEISSPSAAPPKPCSPTQRGVDR